MKRSLFLMLMLNALLGSLMAQNSPIIYSMEDLRFKKIRDGLYTPSNLRLSEIKDLGQLARYGNGFYKLNKQ